ncbi:MAG: type II secretion system F family protein [Patescibacteria group bacterium]|jgi:type II secretory pathway component PulF
MNSKKKSGVSLYTKLSVQLSLTEQLLLTKYLAVLLKSGLPIDDAIEILSNQSKGSLKTILTSLRESVRSGNTLADGLEKFPHVFSTTFINLIRAGENSGTLQGNLQQLADQMQKEHDLRVKIRSAMMYPSIVFMSAITICTGIVVFVLPNITALFKSLDVPLPWTTKVLLWIAFVVQHYGILIATVTIASIVIFMFIRNLSFVKPITHFLTLRAPVLGKIVRNTNLARIMRLLGTLLNTGMALDEALPVTVSVIKNHYYKRLFTKMETTVSEGNTITVALASNNYLVPPIALRLIRVGEETGTLGEMLIYLANFYEQEIDEATKNVTTLIEPIMIVGIGLMVALLAFSIISPIYQVVGSI